jgi:GTP cyclohydrolase I
MNLLGKSNGNLARTPEEIEQMIDRAADAYGHFLNAVGFDCKHTCCSHRGIKHGSVMTTNKFSGVFMEKENLIREEFLHAIEVNGTKF